MSCTTPHHIPKYEILQKKKIVNYPFKQQVEARVSKKRIWMPECWHICCAPECYLRMQSMKIDKIDWVGRILKRHIGGTFGDADLAACKYAALHLPCAIQLLEYQKWLDHKGDHSIIIKTTIINDDHQSPPCRPLWKSPPSPTVGFSPATNCWLPTGSSSPPFPIKRWSSSWLGWCWWWSMSQSCPPMCEKMPRHIVTRLFNSWGSARTRSVLSSTETQAEVRLPSLLNRLVLLGLSVNLQKKTFCVGLPLSDTRRHQSLIPE